MTSDRIQRQIDRLLDDADKAFSSRDWNALRDSAKDVLSLDADNKEAQTYLTAAERNLSSSGGASGQPSPQTPATATPTPTSQPTSFANGRYTVKRFLGEGGKKKVYLAHDASLDRDVAFALIKTEGLDEVAKERVTREAQAMGRLGEHPNNVSVYDIGDESGQPYVVLPLMPGGDVEGEIEKAPEHKLPLERVLQIGIDTCQGLAFAHERGILHRDIKPGNVWIATDGRAQVGDWGLAVASDRTRLTQAGMMVGTPTYMPPEQAMGGEVTPRSDLYSLGAMLYEMVCGRPPFVGDESVAIIGQHLNTPPVAPTWHRPDCPPALEALILRLLEKDPSRRPESAAEVTQALQSVNQQARGRTQTKAESVTPVQDHDPLYRRTFVGRENEVRQLQQAFDAAMSGNGALVMVVGEPGIGKTALCEQLATYVALRGGKALVGHCYEEGSLSLPYLAFVEAMRSYVLAREPEGLRSDLGTGAADVARIVSEVRDRVNVELRPAGDPEDDRWRLLQAITSFLRNASTEQPLVIVLEDLHWADRGTLDLMLHLVRNLQGARFLIVGTYRDVEVDRAHPLSAALAELRRGGAFARVPLRGLTVDEVHRMYEALRGQPTPWGQAEAVHRQTEGNPLFVQEVLRYLVEEGIVVREGGRYVAQGGEGVGIPEGLRDVVGRRLSRLSHATNQVLAVAAVLGRDFRLDVLQRVAGLSDEQVETALQEAQERAIIESRSALGTLAFRFSHAFFRQTLYEEIFASRRLRLHQQVARALEEVYARRLEEHASELAEHFAQSTDAVDLEKALHYSELAAQRATSVFDYGEAVRHLEQALKVLEVLDQDDRAKRCDLLLALGEALIPAGQPLRADEEVAEAGFSLADALQDQKRASRACSIGMDGRFRFGGPGIAGAQSPRYAAWAERADAYASPGTRERVRADLALAGRSLIRGELSQSQRLQAVAYESAKQLDDGALLAEVMRTLIPQQGMLPSHYAERFQLAKEMSGSATWAAGDPVTRVLLLANIGTMHFSFGERVTAEELWSQAEQLAKQIRDPFVELQALTRTANLAFLDGRLEDALAIAQDILRLGEERGMPGPAAREAAAASRAPLVLLGRPDEALARLPTAARPDNLLFLGGIYSSRQALLLALRGRREEAAALLQGFIGHAESTGETDSLSASVLTVLTEVAVSIGDKAAAVTTTARLEPVASLIISSANNVTCPGRQLGAAALLLGEPERAREFYGQGLAACEKVRFRPEVALCRLSLAELLLEHYPDEREAAIEHLDFAIAEFREMKMQPSLERALRHRGLLKA